MSFQDARERWDKRYSTSEGLLFGDAPNGWLASHARHLEPESQVVCVADGEGRNGTYLAGLGHRVQSFDLSPVAIERLRRLAAERGVDLQATVASLDEWQWRDASLDAVVAVFVQFATPPERDQLFADIARALRPGGLAIIEGYGRRQMQYRTGGPGVLENLYTLPMLLGAFARWRVLASRDTDIDLAEGTAHVGRSHVVSVVLRRPD